MGEENKEGKREKFDSIREDSFKYLYLQIKMPYYMNSFACDFKGSRNEMMLPIFNIFSYFLFRSFIYNALF